MSAFLAVFQRQGWYIDLVSIFPAAGHVHRQREEETTNTQHKSTPPSIIVASNSKLATGQAEGRFSSGSNFKQSGSNLKAVHKMKYPLPSWLSYPVEINDVDGIYYSRIQKATPWYTHCTEGLPRFNDS